jgi:hypothetical protein
VADIGACEGIYWKYCVCVMKGEEVGDDKMQGVNTVTAMNVVILIREMVMPWIWCKVQEMVYTQVEAW